MLQFLHLLYESNLNTLQNIYNNTLTDSGFVRHGRWHWDVETNTSEQRQRDSETLKGQRPMHKVKERNSDRNFTKQYQAGMSRKSEGINRENSEFSNYHKVIQMQEVTQHGQPLFRSLDTDDFEKLRSWNISTRKSNTWLEIRILNQENMTFEEVARHTQAMSESPHPQVYQKFLYMKCRNLCQKNMSLEEVARHRPSMDGAPGTKVLRKILKQEQLVNENEYQAEIS